jgi:2Fe-2S ferredoxin
MPKITIRPLDIEIDAPEGETIMSAAMAEGYYWPTTCGGEGRCTTCACVVLSGMERLSPRGRSEERVLTEERGPSILQQPVRLACQAQVYGDVEVEKPGVRLPLSTGAIGFLELKE